MIFKIPSNWNHSVILWLYREDCSRKCIPLYPWHCPRSLVFHLKKQRSHRAWENPWRVCNLFSLVLIFADGGYHRIIKQLKKNSFNLSSQERCSNPLIVFTALLCTHSNRPMYFLCYVYILVDRQHFSIFVSEKLCPCSSFTQNVATSTFKKRRAAIFASKSAFIKHQYSSGKGCTAKPC